MTKSRPLPNKALQLSQGLCSNQPWYSLAASSGALALAVSALGAAERLIR